MDIYELKEIQYGFNIMVDKLKKINIKSVKSLNKYYDLYVTKVFDHFILQINAEEDLVEQIEDLEEKNEDLLSQIKDLEEQNEDFLSQIKDLENKKEKI